MVESARAKSVLLAVQALLLILSQIRKVKALFFDYYIFIGSNFLEIGRIILIAHLPYVIFNFLTNIRPKDRLNIQRLIAI